MSLSDELRELEGLRQRGVLSEEEFARAKQRVLDGAPASSAPAKEAVKRLHRSRHDRWLGGVCGGFSELTDTPAWLWRLGLTLLAVCGGTGVLAYLLLWFFVPDDEPYAPRAASS